MTRTTTTPTAAEPSSGPTTKLTAAFVAVVALLVVAVVAAGWFGYQWAHALVVDRSTAQTRDDALFGAEQAAINLNTADANNLEESLENMRSSITGDTMTKSLEDTIAGITDQMKSTKATQSAELSNGALLELDKDNDTAKALVALKVRYEWPTQYEVNVVTMRMTVENVDGVWKASAVEPVGDRVPIEQGPTPGAEGQPADPNAAPAPEGAPAPEEQPAAPAPEEQPAEPAPDNGGQ
ncbi:hypothetical protein [Rhodococcus sp. NPDC058521]|uniref:hypothetical protein n=1 Tax=Rhodococcus sp. NPDC058521 TaxID=3346536 RepID=UPI0036603740